MTRCGADETPPLQYRWSAGHSGQGSGYGPQAGLRWVPVPGSAALVRGWSGDPVCFEGPPEQLGRVGWVVGGDADAFDGAGGLVH